jgi:D-sedoheptulose 7-phosphate isomerase
MPKNSDLKFIKQYIKILNSLVNFNADNLKKIIEAKNMIIQTQKKKAKIIIFGNGGSSAIASHFTVDMIKNSRIECVNFNEYDHITCMSNDFGYENWIKKTLEFHLKKNDLVILISSSGMSDNIVNAAKFLKQKNNKFITLTGFNMNNSLQKYGNINFWVNSKVYNIVENVHQIILLLINDLTSLEIKDLK